MQNLCIAGISNPVMLLMEDRVEEKANKTVTNLPPKSLVSKRETNENADYIKDF